jgi:hypothetical protein
MGKSLWPSSSGIWRWTRRVERFQLGRPGTMLSTLSTLAKMHRIKVENLVR